MGLQIITGGGAAQFGGGLGKGLNEGYDDAMKQKRDQAEKAAMAQDMIQAANAAIKPRIAALDKQIPADTQVPYSPGKKPWNNGQFSPHPDAPASPVPDYMMPKVNSDRAQLQELAETYAASIKGMTNPDAIKFATEAASGELDRIGRQLLVGRVNNSLKAASESGALGQDEVNHFLERMAGGDDITEVYNDLHDMKLQKIQEREAVASMQSFFQEQLALADLDRQASGAANNGELSAYFTNKEQRIRREVETALKEMEFGLDDFDFRDTMERIMDIQAELNPIQQQREQERLAMRQAEEALQKQRVDEILGSATMSSHEKESALKDLFRGAPGAYPEVPLVFLEPGVDYGLDPEVEGGAGEQGRGVPPASVEGGDSPEPPAVEVGDSPEAPKDKSDAARARKAEAALKGVDPFEGAKAPKDVDQIATQKVGGLLTAVIGEGWELDIAKGSNGVGEIQDRLIAELEEMKKSNPRAAAEIQGQLVELAHQESVARQRIAEQDATRKRINDNIGGAAWGGA